MPSRSSCRAAGTVAGHAPRLLPPTGFGRNARTSRVSDVQLLGSSTGLMVSSAEVTSPAVNLRTPFEMVSEFHAVGSESVEPGHAELRQRILDEEVDARGTRRPGLAGRGVAVLASAYRREVAPTRGVLITGPAADGEPPQVQALKATSSTKAAQ